MIKIYRNVTTVVIILLNIVLFLAIYYNFYEEIRIEYYIPNIFNFFVFIFIYVHVLLLLNLIKNITNWKILNVLIYLIHLITIIILLFVFSFNLKSLTLMLEFIQARHDIICKNFFFKVYYIYSKEQLLNMVRVYYEQYSSINSPLSDELVEKILNNATNMAQVEANVIKYCETEPTHVFQRIKNFYYNNKTWIYILTSVTTINIILVLYSIYNPRTILVVDAPSLDHLRTLIAVIYHLITDAHTEAHIRDLRNELVRMDNIIMDLLRRLN